MLNPRFTSDRNQLSLLTYNADCVVAEDTGVSQIANAQIESKIMRWQLKAQRLFPLVDFRHTGLQSLLKLDVWTCWNVSIASGIWNYDHGLEGSDLRGVIH